jgi:hypothetical protein
VQETSAFSHATVSATRRVDMRRLAVPQIIAQELFAAFERANPDALDARASPTQRARTLIAKCMALEPVAEAFDATHCTRGGGIMDETFEARVRTRAYELWENDGSPAGMADEYWERALQQIVAESPSDPADAVPAVDQSSKHRSAGRIPEEPDVKDS